MHGILLCMGEHWITTQEAVDVSGYHAAHMRALVRRGLIIARKFGRTWMISRESLESYLQAAAESTDGRRGPRNAG